MLKKKPFMILQVVLMIASFSLKAADTDPVISQEDQNDTLGTLKAQIERSPQGCYYIQPALYLMGMHPSPPGGQPMVIAGNSPTNDPIALLLSKGFEVKGTIPATVGASGGTSFNIYAVILCKIPVTPTSNISK